ncbi:MAG TPA: endonuclease/exonuclease/phosphatase family protein [Nocardioides sp.]|jgi:endonuclease/exonuclease/phosphatase family metal-dependent hydrolase|uniref:endonuclease/exonuclease/phosphatase family protein n=1 Tax=Nocardioides sp. TaxID=35761 RepID=UPI002E33E95F|nr:endonuclease/exonuclease/phosphatase family protein [Nocardioides sp.]HEX3932323.1 endonuclease/exonuclease/phosphatase family protein [Nocardioides sp.]
MRRIVSAIVPVMALVAAMAPGAAHSSGTHGRVARTQQAAPAKQAAHSSKRDGIGLDTTAPGATYVHVSWNWIKAASGYRIQVAKNQDFSSVVVARKKANSSHRPAGGREATVVGRLRDATYYWVRVRKVNGKNKAPWSEPVRVATKAHWPGPMTKVRGIAGPTPGTTTIRWKSKGAYTDFYRITTALSPFGSKKTPAVGLDSSTFRVSGKREHLTLTADQVAAAGASLGTGRHLFFRVTAVRQGDADSQERPYGRLMSTTIAGEAAQGHGARLRIGQYNMHIFSRDEPGHPWKKRAHLVAKNIKRSHAAVVSLQEMLPPMWTTQAGGPGLNKALNKVGAGYYKLARTTPFMKGVPGDSRILYNPRKVQLVSNCDPNTTQCLIQFPDSSPHYASYAKFKSLGTGQEFWFVSTHLTPGNDASTDALRGRQATAIASAMQQIDSDGTPVIIGGDFNSSQVSKGSDSPHTALLNAGYYSAMAAKRQVNLQYNSVNAYTHHERPSPYGFGSIIDTIMTLHMPGATVFREMRTGQPWPSDHNMIYADLRLP